MDDKKVVLVTRKTRLDALITRFNTLGQAKFYVEHLGADFDDYLAEHETYYAALRRVLQDLEPLVRVQIIDREFMPNFLFGGTDAVVTLGQDGLVANTLKYLDDQPLIALNPDPKRWEGLLLPFQIADLTRILTETLAGSRLTSPITMARASLNDGQELHAVNDLFIGRKTHVSATYDINSGQRHERQSSSGIIVSTGLGATGWLRSVVQGAAGVMGALTGKLTTPAPFSGDWSSSSLYFAVREPFPGNGLGADLVYGEVTANNPLTIVSSMAENGVIFSDGMENDCLAFSSGFKAVITPAARSGQLVV